MSGFRAELQQLKDLGNKTFSGHLVVDLKQTIRQVGTLTIPTATFGHDSDLPVPTTAADALPGEIQGAHDALRDTLYAKLSDLGLQLFEVGDRLVEIAETYERLDERLS